MNPSIIAQSPPIPYSRKRKSPALSSPSTNNDTTTSRHCLSLLLLLSVSPSSSIPARPSLRRNGRRLPSQPNEKQCLFSPTNSQSTLQVIAPYLASTSLAFGPGSLTSHLGTVYECRPYPFDGWCNNYEPGNDVFPWKDAWIDRGECVWGEEVANGGVEMDESGREEGEGGNPDSLGEEMEELPSCSMYSKYVVNQSYQREDVVYSMGRLYRCFPPPMGELWCGLGGYEPGLGLYWTIAWLEEGECFQDEELLVEEEQESLVRPGALPNFEGEQSHMEQQSEPVELTTETVIVPVVEDDENQDSSSESIVSSLSSPAKVDSPSPPPNHVNGLPPCAPLYTRGYTHQIGDIISFQNYNYRCEVPPPQCDDLSALPRQGTTNHGKAWWKLEMCSGDATRRPTPQPTPTSLHVESTPPPRPEKVENARDAYFESLIPPDIRAVLDANANLIREKVLIRQTAEEMWEPSRLYTLEDFRVALGVLTGSKIGSSSFYLGEGQAEEEKVLYGMVNVAAFLGQSMVEGIQYDVCDEANWDFVNNYYPLSNACGQGGESYQDLHCNEHERHMECPVKKDMQLTAVTNAKWIGGADGAPGPFFCAPKTLERPYTGVWDHLYKCHRPFSVPPEVCDVYDGQQAGRYDNSFPAGNAASRSDVEGCCWWGRGVIQTRGVCDVGKINYFLGAGAENAPYPNVNFCEDPETLCSSQEYPELKWVAGMASWMLRVQSYNASGWEYIPELINFVDGGMVDNSFIEAVDGILTRGCHDDSCGPPESSPERTDTFNMILDQVFNLRSLLIEVGRTTAPTMKPTKRPRRTPRPTYPPSQRPTIVLTKRPVVVTQSPVLQILNTDSVESIVHDATMPSMRPTEWWPWYVDFNKQTCVNDGEHPQWLTQADLFGVKKECCKRKFDSNRYDVCMGVAQTYSWSAEQQTIEISQKEEGVCPPSTGWTASSDCRSYFMCQNGSRSSPMYKCPETFLFDVESSECRHESTIDCYTESSSSLALQYSPAPRPISAQSEFKPTKRPNHSNTIRPSPQPTREPTVSPSGEEYAASVVKPSAISWFGVSVINQEGDKEEYVLPQDTP